MNSSSKTEVAQLASSEGVAATLQSVQIEGRLDGLLLSMTARQHYKNTGETNLEAVYTFPLPYCATLLGLNAEIDGHRLQGAVLEKKQATTRYEKAIDDGNTPVMVERSARGLYTANLGNLKAGETAVIEIEYAQLLRFELGQIRITVPTTVAPRYGDSHKSGGLAAHEGVEANLLVEYPLTVKLELTGEMAQAAVQSPSHAVALSHENAAMVVKLEDGAFLDRDFVLLIQGLQGKSFVTVAPDGEQFAVLASFCPTLTEQGAQPLVLKLLVDCSGSMGGDSIAAAKVAMHEIMKEMTEKDWISYSRFGTEVQHELAGIRACNAATLKRVAKLIDDTDADLGGTEMNAALLSTYKLGMTREWTRLFQQTESDTYGKNVLLITDGEIWGVDQVIDSAKQSGHRVFAIGVGSAPAESLLRDLAEKTGGACELVSPNQDVADVIIRMFRRMRSVRCHDVKVDWAQDVIWQTAAPKVLYCGDTMHLCARMSANPANAPVLSWVSGEAAQQSAARQINSDASDVLSRVLAFQQITELTEQLQRTIKNESPEVALKAQSLDLALRYQLVTDQTNLILVHVREEGMKAEGLPSLEQITHMQAAGWGGAGSVIADSNGVRFSRTAQGMAHACPMSLPAPDYGSMSIPSAWRTRTMSDATARVDALSNGGIDDFEIPAFMRADADGGSTSKFTLTKLIKRFSGDIRTVDCGSVVTPLELLKAFNAVSQKTLAASRFVRDMHSLKIPDHLTKLLDDFTVILGSGRKAWSVLIEWLSEHLAEQFTLSRQAERLLRNSLKREDAVILEELKQRLAKVIGTVQVNAWEAIQTSE